MAIDIFVEPINLIQRINEGIDEIEHAPLLEDYPPQLTGFLPIALTQIAANSTIPLNCPVQPATLNMVITVYVEAETQGMFPNNLEKVYRIAGNWRRKYLDPRTYSNIKDPTEEQLATDVTQKILIEADGLKIYINPTGTETFSGYQVVQYPFGSNNRYHSFVTTLSLKVTDGSC